MNNIFIFITISYYEMYGNVFLEKAYYIFKKYFNKYNLFYFKYLGLQIIILLFLVKFT